LAQIQGEVEGHFHGFHHRQDQSAGREGKIRLPKPKMWIYITRRGGSLHAGRGEPVRVDFAYSRSLDKWFCSILYKTRVNEIERTVNGWSIGIDMNIGQMTTFDDRRSDIMPAPDNSREEARIRRNQRKSARQGKDGKRAKITRKRIAGDRRRAANGTNRRRHDATRQMADNYDTIVIEDLNVKDMTSHGGNRKKKKSTTASGKRASGNSATISNTRERTSFPFRRSIRAKEVTSAVTSMRNRERGRSSNSYHVAEKTMPT